MNEWRGIKLLVLKDYVFVIVIPPLDICLKRKLKVLIWIEMCEYQ